MTRITMAQANEPDPHQGFDSAAEEMAHFDNPANSPFADDSTPVTVQRTTKDKPVLVRFESADVHELQHLAEEEGIATATLIRKWVRERLRTERHQNA